MSQTFSERNLMQTNVRQPIVQESKLPKMPDAETHTAEAAASASGETMAADAQPLTNAEGMPKPAAHAAQPAEPPEQLRAPAGSSEESYLRLRVRVTGNKMSIVDVAKVDGPLAQPDTLSGNFVYEVAHAGKRLAADHVPDLGVRRSYPRKDGPTEGRVHHLEPMSTFEFNVRVSSDALTQTALPQTEIALYQVKADTPPHPMSAQLLSAQFSQHLREVARLKGIDTESLPGPAKATLKKTLR
jgi:hypothetical protein